MGTSEMKNAGLGENEKNGVSSRSDIAEETVNLNTAMRLHRDIKGWKIRKTG